MDFPLPHRVGVGGESFIVRNGRDGGFQRVQPFGRYTRHGRTFQEIPHGGAGIAVRLSAGRQDVVDADAEIGQRKGRKTSLVLVFN